MSSPVVARLVTPRFVIITLSGFAYFVAIGMMLPVLPTYVENELGGGGVAVGLSVGAFGLSSAVMRPLIGPAGDRYGRRFLIVLGGIGAGVALAANVFASTVGLVILFRLALGFGEAGMFVGIAAGIQDLAPDSRRAEAASYFSIAVYSGLATGPLVGEQLQDSAGFDTVWLVAAGACGAAAALGYWAPSESHPVAPSRERGVLHRDALRPGAVLGVNLLAYAAFLAFGALYAEDVGIGRTGLLFALFAVVVVLVRIGAARVPDRVGPIVTTTFACAMSAAGMLAMVLWNVPVGVYIGVGMYALGQAFMFPALFAVTVSVAPASERSHAIATFTMFFDIAVGLGGFLAGAVVALSDERGAFVLGAALCLVSLAMVRPLVAPVLSRRAALVAAGS